jgi:hypothetical protein
MGINTDFVMKVWFHWLEILGLKRKCHIQQRAHAAFFCPKRDPTVVCMLMLYSKVIWIELLWIFVAEVAFFIQALHAVFFKNKMSTPVWEVINYMIMFWDFCSTRNINCTDRLWGLWVSVLKRRQWRLTVDFLASIWLVEHLKDTTSLDCEQKSKNKMSRILTAQ